jgi:hypothetical protein
MVDRMLAETRQALAAVRVGTGAAPEPAEDPSLRGEGAAADGMIRAVVVPGGRLESVSVEPRLLRQGVEEICAQIVVAVNAALDDLATRTPKPDAAVDLAALSTRLESLQDQSVRQMAMFGQAMNAVVAQLRGVRG